MNYIVNVLAIITGLITILGGLYSYFSHRKDEIEKKNKAFEDCWTNLSFNRNEFYKEALELYKKEAEYFSKKGVRDIDFGNNLITREKWLPKILDSSGDFIGFVKLKDVNVDLVKRDIGPVKNNPKWLIDKKKGFAENINILTIKLHKRRMTNGKAYRLISYDFDKINMKVDLKVAESEYFLFQNTCEILSFEMVYAMVVKNQKQLQFKSLPLRKKVKYIFDFENRYVGIGICTLTIFKNLSSENDQNSKGGFLLHERSRDANVTQAMGTIHVVPAGEYQPQGMSFDNFKTVDRFLCNNVMREFGEELLNIPEFTKLNNNNLLTENFIVNNILKNVINDKRNSELYFLGIGIDALNTKCEVLTCLVIDMKEIPEIDMNTFIHNSEGVPKLHPFKKDYISQYMNDDSVLASAREILKIVHENFEYF
jgi:hypothetical protein